MGLRIAQLEKGHVAFQECLAEMQLQAEDFENRSCRNNLQIQGLPKATGPENLQETILAILKRVLSPDPPATMEFDWVHRALGPKPQDPDRPRDVICRLHRYSQKDQVLRAAWSRDQIEFDGAPISIFPDVSRATLQRQAMLKPLLEKLRRAALPYREKIS